MKYKLAIFDFDGTLADSLPWFTSVINQVADTHQFRRIDESEQNTLRGYDARRILKHLDIPMWKLPVIARDIRQRMARDIGNILLFEGIDSMLRHLADRGVLLAIVSSNSTENIRKVLGPQTGELIRWYECGASLFGKGRKFRNVLKKSGISPAEAICIGDEIRDLQAARAENIPFGAVSWGYTNADSFAQSSPDEFFNRIEEIAETIAGLSSVR